MLYDQYADHCREHRKLYGDRTLVLMEVGSFWEVYNDDADTGCDVAEVGRLLNIQTTRKNKSVPQVSRTNPVMTGFPTMTSDKYFPILVDAGYTVVLVGQVTPPPNPRRAVVDVLSRGTYTKQLSRVSNNIACICVEFLPSSGVPIVAVGGAIMDLSTGACHAGESLGTREDPERALDEAYRWLTVHDPVETVLMADDFEAMCARLELPKRACHDRSDDKQQLMDLDYQTQLLRRVYPDTGNLTPAEYLDMERQPWALAAFAGVLRFAFQHNDRVLQNIDKPRPLVPSDGLLVCYNTLRQLGITSSDPHADTLLRTLNRCGTAMGRRLFSDRLLNPIRCVDALRDRYAMVDRMRDRHEDVRATLKQVYDLERLGRKASLGTLTQGDLQSIRDSVEALRRTAEASQEPKPSVDQVCAACDAIVLAIDDAVDLEVASASPSEGRNYFKPGAASTTLDALAGQVAAMMDALRELASETRAKVERNDRDGWFVCTTTKRYKDWRTATAGGDSGRASDAFRSANGLLELSWSQLGTAHTTGAYCRLEHPVLLDFTRRLQGVAADMAAELQRAWLDFVAKWWAAYEPQLRFLAGWAARVDVAATCAWNAHEFRYVRPELVHSDDAGGSFVEASGMRHPVIERLQVREAYVPNDVAIGTGCCAKGVLLYGLNAAGKSSLVKSLAVNVVMAQAGMYVAADAFRLLPYAQMFSRISTGDDIFKGQSTFTIEMAELRNILARADARSLVIGDELCAGTEHRSAVAIVAAGLVALTHLQCSFVFATHLHDLVAVPEVQELMQVDAGLRCYHLKVHFDQDKGRLVYDRKLMPGIGDTLYGVEVCRALRLPLEFVRRAQRIRHGLLEEQRRPVARLHPELVENKRSRYNRRKVVDRCEVCGEMATEVHHVTPQRDADADGFIGHYHKNALHNLMALCERCHARQHDERSSSSD